MLSYLDPRGALLACLVCIGFGLLGAAPAAHAVPGKECTITGDRVDDVIRGTAGRDIICARGGDDLILAGGGDDRVFARSGDNRVYGGRGADQLIGGSGRDRLYGGPGQDAMFGQTDKDLYRGGPDRDEYADGRLKENKNHTVYIQPTWKVPDGTTVKFNYLGGNCTKNEENGGPYPVSGLGQYVFMATGKVGNPWESCAYEKSNAWFRLDFQTPGGVKKSAKILLAQSSTPNIYVRSWTVSCGETEIGCEGGSDSVFGDNTALKVPVSLGPIEEAPPPPPRQGDLNCGGTFHVSVGQKLTDQHVCTSDGNPLPDISFRGLPDGVTGSRWPSAKDTWIVVNGRVTEPGRYSVLVDARQGSWYKTDAFVLDVSK